MCLSILVCWLPKIKLKKICFKNKRTFVEFIFTIAVRFFPELIQASNWMKKKKITLSSSNNVWFRWKRMQRKRRLHVNATQQKYLSHFSNCCNSVNGSLVICVNCFFFSFLSQPLTSCYFTPALFNLLLLLTLHPFLLHCGTTNISFSFWFEALLLLVLLLSCSPVN